MAEVKIVPQYKQFYTILSVLLAIFSKHLKLIEENCVPNPIDCANLYFCI